MERVVLDQGLLIVLACIARAGVGTGTSRRGTCRSCSSSSSSSRCRRPGKGLVWEGTPNGLQDGLRVDHRGRWCASIGLPVDGGEVVVNVKI